VPASCGMLWDPLPSAEATTTIAIATTAMPPLVPGLVRGLEPPRAHELVPGLATTMPIATAATIAAAAVVAAAVPPLARVRRWGSGSQPRAETPALVSAAMEVPLVRQRKVPPFGIPMNAAPSKETVVISIAWLARATWPTTCVPSLAFDWMGLAAPTPRTPPDPWVRVGAPPAVEAK